MPPVKTRDLIALVQRDGWILKRITGSHRQFHHASKKGLVTIAGHPGQDIRQHENQHSQTGRSSMSEAYKYAIVLERTDNGYGAYVPDLPGCVAAAETLEETDSLMREAIALHIELMRESGEQIPPPTTFTTYVEVPLALAV